MSISKNSRIAIIDAKGLILGRMASIVAKRLLNGEKIIIVNAEEAVISGKRPSLTREAHEFLEVGHYRKGPIHPRRPDTIVRKAIRGMLPYKKTRGRDALKRLRVYISVPEEFKGKYMETIPEAISENLRGRYMKVSEIAQSIGWVKQ